ncbi:MAG: DUF1223 domain-containing protein [Paracoccaceae bacterium]
MRALLTILTFALLGFVAPATAGDEPVVVELFTSQGCSSCPPADELIRELAARDDVIPLALHVDYWDYLGWRDSFASAAFSRRQRAYANAAGKRTIYTPQVVVQGESHAIGNQTDTVKSLIASYSGTESPVDLNAWRGGDVLFVRVRATGAGVGPVVIQIVRFLPERAITIRGGENAGRRIVYANIVTEWMPVAMWNGSGETETQIEIKGQEPVAVLIQSEDFGPILAARILQ